MIKSMTGFGRAEVITKERKITVELKSVNHRYLDLSIKMPRKLVFLEGAIRNLMKTYMQRGKVDVFITYEDYTLSCGALKYNKELAGEYLAYIRQMAEEFGLENDVKAGALSRYPDVLTMEEQSVDEDALWAVLEAPLREACEKFAQSRAREGENLKNALIAKPALRRLWILTERSWKPRFMSFWRILRSKIPVLQQKLSCSLTRSATMRRLFVSTAISRE